MMDKVFLVRSRLDRHHGKPYLAIFSSYADAELYRDRVIKQYEVPEYATDFVWIEETSLDPVLIPLK